MRELIRAEVEKCVNEIVNRIQSGVVGIVAGEKARKKNGDKRKVLKLGTHGYKIDMTCRHVDGRGNQCGELSGGPRNGMTCAKHRK